MLIKFSNRNYFVIVKLKKRDGKQNVKTNDRTGVKKKTPILLPKRHFFANSEVISAIFV